MTKFHISQTAESTPFDNTGTGFASEDVRSAIIESSLFAGTSRYIVTLGHKGNSGNGRWLEIFQNSPSNTSPYVVPEISQLVSLSVSNKKVVTGSTFTVYRNGSSIATITLTAASYNYIVLGTPVTLSPGDIISAQQTSGPNTTDPVLFPHIKAT